MPRDNRSMYMTQVSFYVCYSDCVNVVKVNGCLSLGVLKYVVCLCKRCDGCCVFCLYGDA